MSQNSVLHWVVMIFFSLASNHKNRKRLSIWYFFNSYFGLNTCGWSNNPQDDDFYKIRWILLEVNRIEVGGGAAVEFHGINLCVLHSSITTYDDTRFSIQWPWKSSLSCLCYIFQETQVFPFIITSVNTRSGVKHSTMARSQTRK